jgi:opacity protein-like surface antigen
MKVARRVASRLLLCVAFGVSAASVANAACGPVNSADTDDIAQFGVLANGAATVASSLVSSLNTVNTSLLGQGTSAFVSAPPGAQPNQQGGGVWVRGTGGTEYTRSTSNVVLADGDADGSTACRTALRENFEGIQIGADISRLNIGGTNLHWGLTTGYAALQSKSETFYSDLQVPFVGLYGALTNGGFFADGQVRGDFYQGSMNDLNNGIHGQRYNARGTSVSGNMGYHFDLGNSWFIEPSGGLAWSVVGVDPINFAGTAVNGGTLVSAGLLPPGVPPGGTAPGTLEIHNIYSLLARGSVRAGTSFQVGNYVLSPFGVASVFHEYAGNVVSHLRNNQCIIPGAAAALGAPCVGAFGQENLVDTSLSTTRVGTYGQFGLGISGQLVNTGWLGFARVDYRTGSNIEGISGTAGIRYQFTPDQFTPASPRAYARVPVRAPVLNAPLSGPYNWTGVYVGGFAGGSAWGNADWVSPNGATSVSFAGVLIGGDIGYNYQVGPWVYGIEGDLGWSNAIGGKSAQCPSGGVNSFFYTCEVRADWLSTVTGRIGYAVDRTLFYAKGGLAVGEVNARAVFNPGSGFSPAAFNVQPGLAFSSSNTGVGWTAGAGFEFALTRNCSFKAEYKYFDLGSSTYQLDVPVKVRTTGNIGLVGLNYHLY